MSVGALTQTGEVPQQKLHQNTRSGEPPAPAVRVLGLVGGLVQIPTAGPHQVTTDIQRGLNGTFKIKALVLDVTDCSCPDTHKI